MTYATAARRRSVHALPSSALAQLTYSGVRVSGPPLVQQGALGWRSSIAINLFAHL